MRSVRKWIGCFIAFLMATTSPSFAFDIWLSPTHLIGEATVQRDIPAELVSFVVQVELDGVSAHELAESIAARRAAIGEAIGSARIPNSEKIEMKIEPLTRFESMGSGRKQPPEIYYAVEIFRGTARMKYTIRASSGALDRIRKVTTGEVRHFRFHSWGHRNYDEFVADLKKEARQAAIADAEQRATIIGVEKGDVVETEYTVARDRTAREDAPVDSVTVKATVHYQQKFFFPRLRPDPNAKPQELPWSCFDCRGTRF